MSFEMFVNHTSRGMSNELTLSNRSRKRVREVERKTEPESYVAIAWNALNLINRFNELTLFEDNPERINDKDTISQDFIDRFEKLYRPAAVGEERALEKWPIELYNKNIEKCSVKLTLKYGHDEYALATKDDCPIYIFNDKFAEELGRRKLLDDFDFPNDLQKDLTPIRDRCPPYGWFADIIMGKAVIETDLFGTRSGKMLMYGVDNFNSDFYATIGWTTMSKKDSVKALMYVDSGNDSDSNNDQVTIAAKQKKRRKLN